MNRKKTNQIILSVFGGCLALVCVCAGIGAAVGGDDGQDTPAPAATARVKASPTPPRVDPSPIVESPSPEPAITAEKPKPVETTVEDPRHDAAPFRISRALAYLARRRPAVSASSNANRVSSLLC